MFQTKYSKKCRKVDGCRHIRTDDSITCTNKSKFMCLSLKFNIIRSNFQIFTHTTSPKKICGSCSNGLIMANLFRVKVIESNAICRDLCVKREIEEKSELERDVKTEIVPKTEEEEIPEQVEIEEPMYEEYLDETFLNVIERQMPVGPKPKFVPLKKLKKGPFSSTKAHKSSFSHTDRCCLCTNEVDVDNVPCKKYEKTLKNITQFDGFRPNDHICNGCKKKIKRAESYFFRAEQPLNIHERDPRTPCQFCLKRCREVREASLENVETYFSLPPSPSKPRNVMVGGRCCPICVRNLESIASLYKYLTHKQKKRKKIVSKSFKESSFDDYISIEETLDDYQCHMSEIEDSDSDTSLPDVLFGEPLNTPITQELFKCPFCKLTTSNLPKLEAHIEIYHQTPTPVCNICNKTFKSLTVCKQHKCRVHFSDTYHGYYKKLCEFCGLATKFFEAHVTTHTNSKPFMCDLCGHRSRTKVRIAEHILAVHTNQRRYKCRFCEKGFSYHPDKVRHEISNHTKAYKYVCEICKKCFLKKNFLKAHQDTHEGVFLKQIE